MSEYFNLPCFNNDLLDTAHSVHSVQPVHSVHSYTPYNRYFLLLAAIADVQGEFFDIDFTSYIKAHTHLL